jgi:hypothetical protein
MAILGKVDVAGGVGLLDFVGGALVAQFAEPFMGMVPFVNSNPYFRGAADIAVGYLGHKYVGHGIIGNAVGIGFVVPGVGQILSGAMSQFGVGSGASAAGW